jgi:hypothetical protein
MLNGCCPTEGSKALLQDNEPKCWSMAGGVGRA